MDEKKKDELQFLDFIKDKQLTKVAVQLSDGTEIVFEDQKSMEFWQVIFDRANKLAEKYRSDQAS